MTDHEHLDQIDQLTGALMRSRVAERAAELRAAQAELGGWLAAMAGKYGLAQGDGIDLSGRIVRANGDAGGGQPGASSDAGGDQEGAGAGLERGSSGDEVTE